MNSAIFKHTRQNCLVPAISVQIWSIPILLSHVLHDLGHDDHLVEGQHGALEEALGQALANVVSFVKELGRALIVKFLEMKECNLCK